MIILIIVLVVIIVIVFVSRKKHIGEIHTTYDGFFDENKKIKKKRNVVIEDIRADGAISVRKIHRKEECNPNMNISGLELDPSEHPRLDKVSVVEKRVLYGRTQKDKSKKPIYLKDLDVKNNNESFPNTTKDKLTKKESRMLNKFRKQDKRNQKTNKKWKNHFK